MIRHNEQTSAEVRFVRSLGKHSTITLDGRTTRTTRADLLRRYIYASQRRVDWDGIDQHAVLSLASSLLAAEVNG